jgi:hypothetical protein
MLKIEIEEPDPVRKFNSAVPADLQAIIQKCLEKGAERRYETATKLSDDLERWLFGQPVKARPVTALTRCARRLRRKPIVRACTVIDGGSVGSRSVRRHLADSHDRITRHADWDQAMGGVLSVGRGLGNESL